MKNYNLTAKEIHEEVTRIGQKQMLAYLRDQRVEFSTHLGKLESLKAQVHSFESSYFTDEELDLLESCIDRQLQFRDKEMERINQHIDLIKDDPVSTMRSPLGSMDPAAYD